MVKHYFEDYSIGERFVTPARTITETDIINFAGLTGDWHPLHTDIVYSQNSMFKERIAHGALVFSIGSALSFRLGANVITPKSFIAFYGMDKLRFTDAVRIGDTIHLEFEVADMVKKTDEMGIVLWQNEIKNQNDILVCSYSSRVACGRKL